MKNGIYGLFSLDGAPLDARDRTDILGETAPDALVTPTAAVACRDAALSAVHVRRDDRGFAALLGDLDEPEAVAARLGAPASSDHAGLAAAALERWGRATPCELAGEWLFLRWDEASRTATLVMSECALGRFYWASDGRRLAIAPELARLAKLPWIDGDFDPDMLMRSMGRFYLRVAMGGRTIVKGVRRMEAAALITVRRDQARVETPERSAPAPLVEASFEDALAEIDPLLRRIVRRRLRRADGVAVQMSGGLDSSLMGLLAAQERGADQRLVFLTSAAPAGGGVEDETRWAALVAEHLGAPMIRVTPAADANVYRPRARTLALYEWPTLSPRHYLYEALCDAGAEAGAQLLVDGVFGELTISSHGRFLTRRPPRSPRAIARWARDRLRNRFEPTRSGDYQVMPARHAVAGLKGLRSLRPAVIEAPRRDGGDPFGIDDGFTKVVEQGVEVVDPRLRCVYPLRDPRLIRLMASYPSGLVRHGGVDRAPIRALMRGGLPDAIVTRPKGLAFSPTYDGMLRDQAGAAIDRLDAHRAAGADEWLDLVWLEAALGRARDGVRMQLRDWFRIQATAYAAEFFCWWRENAR